MSERHFVSAAQCKWKEALSQLRGKRSLQVLVKATPEVPRYNAAAFAHTQELMIFGGILRQDEAQKDFKNMFTNKYVDMFAPPAS